LNLKSNASVPNFQSDGLTITAAESWFKVKVQLILSYSQAFIMNASPKSDELIFVDLFAGSGLFSVGHQKEIFPGPSLALSPVTYPFKSGCSVNQILNKQVRWTKEFERFFHEVM
jgi:hypothetical protein